MAMRVALLLLIALLLPARALAQSCVPPASFATPHAVTPRDDEPVRQAAVAGYTLALTWAPEYCHGRRDERARGQAGDDDGFECGGGFARRFVLHGLWPDAAQADAWPEYCRPAAILPASVIRANLCMTPSPQLLQHEWAKHGVCMARDPASYFAAAKVAFAGLRYPDMFVLARDRALTAGRFAEAFATANPGMSAAMLRIGANKRGWLEEVRVCLGRDRRPAACPSGVEGAAPGDPLRIEAGFSVGPSADYREGARSPRSSRWRGDADRDGGG